MILAATNGQSFLSQAVAYELVQFLNQQQRKEASEQRLCVALAYRRRERASSAEPISSRGRKVEGSGTVMRMPDVCFFLINAMLRASAAVAVSVLSKRKLTLVMRSPKSCPAAASAAANSPARSILKPRLQSSPVPTVEVLKRPLPRPEIGSTGASSTSTICQKYETAAVTSPSLTIV